jgi:hypothetical protein
MVSLPQGCKPLSLDMEKTEKFGHRLACNEANGVNIQVNCIVLHIQLQEAYQI